MDSLVSANWLSLHIDAPDMVVLDCTNSAAFDPDTNAFRTVNCLDEFKVKHIKGAQYADFSGHLSGKTGNYRNNLPDIQSFVQELERLGVGTDRRVVLYDSGGSMWAARLWWMLRWIGFDNAAVLDGGLRAWCELEKPQTGLVTPRPSAILKINECARFFVDKIEVLEALNEDETILIDALSAEQFAGTQTDLGLGGHITGARNIPATSLLDTRSGRFLPLSELALRMPKTTQSRVIVYCGSGIAASANAFTLHRLGFENLSIYMPGLQEWMDDPNAPMENRPLNSP